MKIKLENFSRLIVVLFVALISLSISSCGKDDEPDDNSIVGEWRLSLKEYDGSYWYCQYKFNLNGTFECKDWDSEEREPVAYESFGTYNITESLITIKFDDEDESETYRYTLSGNKLTMYDYDVDGPNDFYRL